MKRNLWNKTYAFAALLSAGYAFFTFFGFKAFDSQDSLKRLFILLGGDFNNGGIIQSFIFFAFVWSFLEIRKGRRLIKAEFKYLCLDLLPTSEKHVLLPLDIPHIEKKINNLNKSEKGSILGRLLNTAILKFKSTLSMSETIDVISIQSDISRELHESE